ncbi:MAG: FKBP-type peptidyl-prolyl cis-trans isomerase N-terminal domain-containing protein [Rikenellaceae bacterium]
MKKVVFTALIAGAMVMASCSGGQQSAGTITVGDKSKMDSLSYSLGANIAYSVTAQMADVPFDFDSMTEGFEAAALGKNTLTADEAIELLQSYFMETRAERAQIVEQKRAEADSLAIAGGADAAEVAAARAELKADADMFESEAQREEVSYAFGIDLGTNIKSAELPVQVYWLATALTDVSNGTAKVDEQAAMAYLQNYFTVVRPAEMAEISAKNLADIEKKSGVKKTESGLLYRVESEGDKSVMAVEDADVVKVNYTGRLVRNNEVFDTSRFADRPEEQKEMLKAQNPEGYDQDAPIEFALNRVIPGWTEGMKLVGKGGRISLWIPAELAYGANGAGNSIGPNEALYFDVELIDVNPTAAE